MSKKITISAGATSRDLSFYQFSKYVLGYSKFEDVHKKWCDEVDNTNRRKLFMKPRGTYKSTLYTVAYPIWKLIQNPNETILIASSTSDNAEAFLREISGHFIRNPRLKEMCGALIDPNASKVSSITLLNRTSFQKEASISTVGVLGNLVSSHYSTIIADDLVNDKDRESESIREKKKKWFLDLISVLNPDGEIVCCGTRWHFSDLYNYIINDINPKLEPVDQWYIGIESCYLDDGVTPRFPTILPTDILERLKVEKGPMEFSSQYQNNPLPQEAQIFFEEDFQTFEYLGLNRVLDNGVVKTVEFVGYCDLSIGKSRSADFTGLVTLGQSKDGVVYIVDVVLERMPPDKTMETIFTKHKIFNYRNYGVESNVFQSLFSEQMKKYSAANQSYLPIIEVGHSSNKNLRIQSLQPIIKQGLLKIKDDWHLSQDYKELMKEFVQFPLCSHDDGPDSVEGAFSLLKKCAKWKGSPFFASGTTSINVSGFSTNLEMEKFDFNISTPTGQQQQHFGIPY